MQTSRPNLTTQLRDGALEHVVVVAGKPVQAHSTLKAAMCALALAMALSGCSVCRTHEVACTAVTFIAVSSLALSLGHHDNSGTKGTVYEPSTPLTYPGVKPVNCTTGECL